MNYQYEEKSNDILFTKYANDALQSLLEKGLDINVYPFSAYISLTRMSKENMNSILEHYINPNRIYYNLDLMHREVAEMPFLSVATYFSNVPSVKVLLKYGANVNATDSSGKTALMYAIMNTSNKLVTVLINAGADLYLKDKQGDTALDLATQASGGGLRLSVMLDALFKVKNIEMII